MCAKQQLCERRSGSSLAAQQNETSSGDGAAGPREENDDADTDRAAPPRKPAAPKKKDPPRRLGGSESAKKNGAAPVDKGTAQAAAKRQRDEQGEEPKAQPALPNIPRVTNMMPGSKGRNFESFSGLLMVGNEEEDAASENLIPVQRNGEDMETPNKENTAANGSG